MMPGRSFIPYDMCASEFLKINFFLYIFPARVASQNTNTDGFYGYFSSWNAFKWEKTSVFSHAEDNSHSFSFSMGQTYILRETEGWKGGVKGRFST